MPNYASYTLEELQDAYEHINKQNYPQRTLLIKNEIIKRKQELAKHSELGFDQMAIVRQMVECGQLPSSKIFKSTFKKMQM